MKKHLHVGLGLFLSFGTSCSNFVASPIFEQSNLEHFRFYFPLNMLQLNKNIKQMVTSKHEGVI